MKIKCYPPNLPSFPLYPSTIELNERQSKIIRPKGYSFDEIFVVTDGAGLLEIDGETFTLEKNDMYYLKSGVSHGYTCIGDCFTTSYLSFFGEGRNTVRKYYSLGNFGIYKGKSQGRFESHLKELYSEFDGLQEFSTLSAMTYSCVIAFFDEACKKEYTPIEKVYNYLASHYSSPIILEDLLVFYPYSKTKLCTDFKNTYRKSIFDILTEIRIGHAREMLMLNPHLPLKNIAEASGYSDVSYFCKVYKKLLGTTPKSSYLQEAEPR